MSNDVTSPPKNEEVYWCLVGNVIGEHPYGEGGKETRSGTKAFSAGTKVYCLPGRWGDGYEKIMVIGRHRGSNRYSTMVIPSMYISNWRTKIVYSPEVIRRIKEEGGSTWSKKLVDEYVVNLSSRKNFLTTNHTVSPVTSKPLGDLAGMNITTQRTLKLVGLLLLSATVTFVLFIVASGVVSGLSRPMQGESVSVPWPVCVLLSVAVTTFLPWLVSLPFVRQPRMRLYFLICLVAASVVWYFVGFDELLNKAYRRGL